MRNFRFDDRTSMEHLMSMIREEQAIYDMFFQEVIRQVRRMLRMDVHCCDDAHVCFHVILCLYDMFDYVSHVIACHAANRYSMSCLSAFHLPFHIMSRYPFNV